MEKGDELRAIETLTRITIDHPGVAYIDRVVYLLGSAHLKAHDFVEAQASFRRLGRDYPFSEYADDALFLIGEASWRQVDSAVTDPEPALKARDEFQSFLREYPDSPRASEARARLVAIDELLAEKKYRNAETYQKLGHPQSVVVYVRRLLEEYPTTRVVPDGVLLMARAHRELGEARAACDALVLLRSLPQTSERPDLVNRARELHREWGCETTLGTAEATP
jgi:outer membrane protein assembly factor BamD